MGGRRLVCSGGGRKVLLFDSDSGTMPLTVRCSLPLFAIVMLTGCPGELKNPECFPLEDPLPPCADENFDPTAIFISSCGSTACHEGDDPQAGLDLIAPGVFERMANMPAGVDNAECPDLDALLVDTENSRESFLIKKLAGTHECGDRMPLVGFLNSQEISCMRRWIEISAGNAPVIDNACLPDDEDAGPPREERDAGPSEETDSGMPAGDAGPMPEVDAAMMMPVMDAGMDAGMMMMEPEVDCAVFGMDGNILCEDMADMNRCTGVFMGMEKTCVSLCEEAGLECITSYSNGDGCDINMGEEFNCMGGETRMSDHCICGMP